jgi:hypothetical protein
MIVGANNRLLSAFCVIGWCGCSSAEGSIQSETAPQVPGPVASSTQQAKVGTETTEDKALVVVNFGPLQEFQSDAPFYRSIAETDEGHSDQLLVSAVKDAQTKVAVTIRPYSSDTRAWSFADDGVGVSVGSPEMVATQGTMTLNNVGADRIRLDLADVTVVAYDTQHPDVVVRSEELGAGSFEGKVETICLPLGALAGQGSNGAENREPSTVDSTWATPFCRRMKEQLGL